MADTEKPADAVPYRPPSSIDPAELAAAFEKEGLVPAKPPPPVADPPKDAPPADDGTPALLKLAKDKDAQRKLSEQKELDAAKPYMDALKVLSPVEAAALARAKQMGDPISALTALGFTHAQYTERLLGQKSDEPEKDDEKPAENAEVLTLKQRLEQLENERKNEQLQSQRALGLSKMKDILKGDAKYRLINEFQDVEGVERVILQYIQENGKPPGDTFEESVRLAAELYEYDLKQQAARWQKVLTPASEPAQTPAKEAPAQPPPTGNESPRTLTNASTSAPAAARPSSPKTRQELIAAFIEKGEEVLG